MSKQIIIDPITRIEGHSKVTINLDDSGDVVDAHFHVTQFRGFEKLCEGRPVHEMPSLMARICGICPVSHLVASAKTCDEILAVEPPPTGADLRRLMNLGQIVQSNSLSFFHLSAPDLLFGFDADPAKRHLYGMLQENPQLAVDGIALRKFGQQMIETLGGKRIHPAWIVPGGVSAPLQAEQREQILAQIPEVIERLMRGLVWFKEQIGRFEEEASVFGKFPTAFMSLVTPEGTMEHYDGLLRVIDSEGNKIVDDVNPNRFEEFVGEAVEPDSYLKSVYLKHIGYPEGIYRVGPLARVNACETLGTERADAELVEFRARLGRYPSSSFDYHWARLIDTLFSVEKIEAILRHPDILSSRVRSEAEINRNEGVGVSEAPRGTLMHHYVVDDDGIMQTANLIIATGNNNMAMNRGVTQVAQHYIKGGKIEEQMLNKVEGVIRCYDPCLSCSTHAVGQMALHIQLVGPNGEIVDEVRR